ncbi:MAG TPA: hypothetical protein VGO93_06610 [Candidatus Xenobia bacterium]
MTSDQLVLERRDGWPNGLAHLMVAAALLFFLIGQCLPDRHDRRQMTRYGVLCVLSSLSLHLYRRGSLLDRQSRTLYRWWGVGMPGFHTVRLRSTLGRSLQGWRTVSVHRTGRYDTWKTWRHNMLHVQLERPDDKLGPAVPFRMRLIVDDEFTSPEAALKTAHRVGQFLGLAVVDATTPTGVGL